MREQGGFWDIDVRYVRLSEAGDPLEKLNALVPWEIFRKPLAKALKRSDGAKGGRPSYDPVMRSRSWFCRRSTACRTTGASSGSRTGCRSCVSSG